MEKKGYLGEWCKWSTCMNSNAWKGPIFDVKETKMTKKNRKIFMKMIEKWECK
jgi:hypothetical protein